MKVKEKLNYLLESLRKKNKDKKPDNTLQQAKNDNNHKKELINNNSYINDNNLNKKRVRNEINNEDSSFNGRDRFDLHDQDLHNQTASFFHNNSSISNSRVLTDNSYRFEGNSVLTDNKLIDTRSDFTVGNINPGRISENNSLIRTLLPKMKKEENTSNLYNVLGKGNISDSSFIGRFEDNYKSSSDISGTTYKNNVELNDSDPKEHSFRDKDEFVKINEPEYQDKSLLNNNYLVNFLKEKEILTNNNNEMFKQKIQENLLNIPTNNLFNETPATEEKKNYPKIVKIAFRHLLDSKKKEKTTKNFVLESEKKETKKEIMIETNIIISHENLLFSIVVYISVSLTLIFLLKKISEKGELSEVYYELTKEMDMKKGLILVICMSIFLIYYNLILKYKIVAKEIYELIEANLKYKGLSQDYFISETHLKSFCTNTLNYSTSVYYYNLLPLIKNYLFENPNIETSYLTGDSSLKTRWSWKCFVSDFK